MGSVKGCYYFPDIDDVEEVLCNTLGVEEIDKNIVKSVFDNVIDPCLDSVLDVQLDSINEDKMKELAHEEIEALLAEFKNEVASIFYKKI